MRRLATSFFHYLKVWLVYARLKLMRYFVYRGDFIFSSLGSVSWIMVTLITYRIIFSQVNQIAGWSWGEMVLLYGVYNLFWGIFVTFLSGGHDLGWQIRHGGFDTALLKPMNSIFSATLRVTPDTIVHIITGLLIFIFGIGESAIAITTINFVFFLILFINGLILGYFLGLVFGCSAFWMTENNQVVSFFWNVETLAKYPSDFYKFNKVIYTLIFTLIPIMFIAVVPVRFLSYGFDPWLFFGSFIATGFVAVIAVYLWKAGVKKYNGVSV
jgi:ABC-2 type transport system permease protein